MKRLELLAVLLLIGITMTVAGCLGNTRQTGSSNGTAILYNHTYIADSSFMHARERVYVNVTAGDGPVNVLVLGSKAYDLYCNATDVPRQAYNMYVSELNVTRAEFNFTVPEDDTYYIIADNTGRVPGGVDGNHDVRVNTSCIYYERPLF